MAATAGRRLVCGVDSSTQSTKVEVREIETGACVATGQASHPVTTPPRSEQDPEAWWTALRDAMRAAADVLDGGLREVVAISVAGQQHAMVVTGADGTALRPAKLWNDTESAPHATALIERLGGAAMWAQRVGSVPVAAFTITKLAWLAEHDPVLFAVVEHVLLPHDWLTFRLTGSFVTDRGDASGSGWWSARTGRVDMGVLDLVDPAMRWAEMVPTVLDHNAIAGEITPAAAQALGLPTGCLVAAGTGDNMGAALGLGLGPGDIVMSLGTSGTIYSVSDSATADASGAVAGFADATGRFLPLVCTLNATRVTDTVAGLMGADRDEMARLALSSASGADGLILVPYLDGERTPNLPGASGLITGLRTATSRAALARAAHEGVVCGLLDGADALAAVGVAAQGRAFLVGGGARSAAYQRVVADLWARPVRVPFEDEVVATGACVQAAVVAADADPIAVGRQWGLGAGEDHEPDGSVDTLEVRDAYRAAAMLSADR